MNNLLRSLDFHFMAAILWFRYRTNLPAEAIAEAGIKPGDTVLDFGCASGGFSVQAARAAGQGGTVYALDINPLAARYVTRRAQEANVTNIKTITSGRDTGLADRSIHAVLLYDILHDLVQRDRILSEIFRVLTDNGRLSVSDHHLTEDKIVAGITKSGLFRFEDKGKLTYTFIKAQRRGSTAARAD